MSEKKSGPDSNHELRIHIDRKPYHSPNPTIGEALYILGNIPASHELYREVQGDAEDKPVENGVQAIHLKEDEHFYSTERRQQAITIIVNARKKIVPGPEVSFAEIVALAFDNPPTGSNLIFTVAYRKGEGNSQGTLVAGASVKVKEGMIFDVTATDRS